ncbi:hypothetical protein ACTMU2_11005 [Cupriavidus basilensis]
MSAFGILRLQQVAERTPDMMQQPRLTEAAAVGDSVSSRCIPA